MIRPLLLKGHERPVSDVKYNTDGDLIFVASKDQSVSVWWTENGERIGTYEGHNGAIMSLDVNRDASRLLTASADQSVRLWEVETGRTLFQFSHVTSVRVVAFAEGDQMFLSVNDQIMGFKPEIHTYKVTEDPRDMKDKSQMTLFCPSQVLGALWGYHNEQIITANADGSLHVYDTETRKEVRSVAAHRKEVMAIRPSYDKTVFITASKDGTAKLFDLRSQEEIKMYETGRPINAAALSPVMDHVIVGGGERAEDVTQSGMTSEQFKVRFYHSIFGDELGSIAGHFGPVNVLAFSPDGRSFASGSEDGFVRLHYFGDEYFNRADEVSTWDRSEAPETKTKA